MISRIHQKLGTAGFVIAIVALVAALTGAAYAASGSLSGKQKKEVEKISKKYAGKPGATGATGPQGMAGPAGPKGDTGAAGTNGKDGTNGTNGKSVALVNEAPEECPGESGFTYEVEGSGEENEVCSSTGAGGGGSAELPKTLGPEEVETGTWSTPSFEYETFVPISFPVPLGEELDGSHVVRVNEPKASVPAECNDGVAPPPSVSHPEAKPGYLCVFRGAFASEPEFTRPYMERAEKPQGFSFGAGAAVTGVVVNVVYEESGLNHGAGTWAVTGALGN